MNDDDAAAELATTLAGYARAGIYVSLNQGDGLAMPGLPTKGFSLSEIQATADSFPDEQMRSRIQQRIGLAPFIHLSQRFRNELFAQSCGQSKWANVPRSEQDRPLRLLARRLLDTPIRANVSGATEQITPYNGWDVLEYEVRNVLPEGEQGPAIQTHWRRIRSKVDGLLEFRVTQNANWSSGHMPSYKMISGGEHRIENVRETTDGGEPGHRFDFVVDIDRLNIGDVVDIRWIREYEFEPNDLGKAGDDSSMVVAPIVRIEHAVMSVKFSRALIPNAVWSIVNVPNQDRTVIPRDRQVIILVNGLASVEFFDLPIGYTSGIGWSWDTSSLVSDRP